MTDEQRNIKYREVGYPRSHRKKLRKGNAMLRRNDDDGGNCEGERYDDKIEQF
jgi:hypothetical protein